MVAVLRMAMSVVEVVDVVAVDRRCMTAVGSVLMIVVGVNGVGVVSGGHECASLA